MKKKETNKMNEWRAKYNLVRLELNLDAELVDNMKTAAEEEKRSLPQWVSYHVGRILKGKNNGKAK